MATNQLQVTIEQAQRLTFAEQLQLIKYLADKLAEAQPKHAVRYLEYGKYRDAARPMSSEEDFKLAEWRPTEEDLNEY